MMLLVMMLTATTAWAQSIISGGYVKVNINGSGTVTVTHGSVTENFSTSGTSSYFTGDYTINFVPSSGYEVNKVTLKGLWLSITGDKEINVDRNGGSYTSQAIAGTEEYTVFFEKPGEPGADIFYTLTSSVYPMTFSVGGATVSTAKEGDRVDVTLSEPVANGRWELLSSEVGLFTKDDATHFHFTMPGRNVTVQATLIVENNMEYTITDNSTHGHVNVGALNGNDWDIETAMLTVEPDAGYEYEDGSLSATNLGTGEAIALTALGNGRWAFTMPKNNIAVSATFTPDPTHFADNGDGSYTIKTTAGWGVFCDALQDNDTYNRFIGKTVKLGADITVTRMAGSSSHDFCGTFDGQEHTLTFNYTTDENDAAPFRYVEDGCVIKDLRVCGTIETSAKFAAGLIAHQYGNVTIRNCRSSVTIKSSVSSSNGDGTHGGFVAENHSTADITFEGCLFDGKLLKTGSTTTTRCGGFVGWRSNNDKAVIKVKNSLYAPASPTGSETWISTTESATFVRNGIASDITNSYYTSDFNNGTSFTGQGKAPRTVTGGTNVTVSDIAPTGTPTEYNVSGITAYSNGGLALDNGATLYYGSGDVVSLTLSNSATGAPLGYQYGYSASAGTLSGSANPYTLTMPDEDVTITATLTAFPWSGTGEVDSPYVIEYPSQLDLLATNVNGGNDYVNTYFVLGADITYTHKADNEEGADTENNYTAIGYYDGSNYYDFKGHFDGQGHTVSGIRIYKSGSDATDAFQGIFGYTDGATIQNITLADTRITGYQAIGGIVGYNKSGGTVSDCHVTADVTIHAVQSNAANHGGIVGDNKGTVTYCTSATTLTTTSGGSGYGGIAGVNDGTLSNNLAIGAVVPEALWSYYGAICGGNYNTLRHNYYYHCTVAGAVNTTGKGCKNANVNTNNGAVPGIVLYDNSSKTDINSYILTTVGNEEVSCVFLSGRTLYKDGNWNTLCLPFDVTVGSGQLTDATAMTMNASESGFDASTGVLTLNFDNVTSGNTIAAGTPFIVKWTGTDLPNPVFNGVTIDNSAEALARKTVTSTDSKVSFLGIYSSTNIYSADHDNLFLGIGKNNQNEDVSMLYWPSTTDYTLGAFRAYFHVDLTETNGVRDIVLNFEDGTQTVIGHTDITDNTDKADAAWYSLDGRKLDAKPSSKGIYIHGGRKVVIK